MTELLVVIYVMQKSGEVVVKNLFILFSILVSIEARAYTFEVLVLLTWSLISKQLSGKRFILDNYLTDSGMESESTDSGSYDRFIANQLMLVVITKCLLSLGLI